MSSVRRVSRPPQLPGFDYVRVLGIGGFADVFLYRQHLPSRLVAVKVLLATGLDDETRSRFTEEANLTAQLSHHPSIVTVHHASVAVDGRPYLVMEYCSQPSLGQRYRAEKMGVAEVLRIGVRLASAVETAHRAGVLHRDIKPANVLVTDFGWPALTDFGIAATVQGGGGAVGLSVPWAPPEMLAEPPTADERSDVYCLAATLYSLLAGRSPFEVPGGANGAADLIVRIERDPVPPIGRGEVPDALVRVLARAMAKQPGERHPSALAFGRALQQVEIELSLPVTTLDLPESASASGWRPDSPEATRPRGVVTVSPEPATPPPATPTPAAGPGARAQAPARTTELPAPTPEPLEPDATRPRAPVEVHPAAAPVTGEADAAPREPHPSHARRDWTVGAAVVVVAAVAGLVAAWLRGGTPPGPADPMLTDDPVAPAVAVPVPGNLVGERAPDGSARFTWTNPAAEPGDRYRWGVVTATGEEPLEPADRPTATVPADEVADEVCIQVFLVRADGRVSSEPARGCAG